MTFLSDLSDLFDVEPIMRYYLIPVIVLILFIMGAIEWNHNKMNPCLPDGFPDGRAALGLQPITCFVD